MQVVSSQELINVFFFIHSSAKNLRADKGYSSYELINVFFSSSQKLIHVIFYIIFYCKNPRAHKCICVFYSGAKTQDLINVSFIVVQNPES